MADAGGAADAVRVAAAGHHKALEAAALADDEFSVRHERRPALENAAHTKVGGLAVERRELLDEPAHHIPILLDARRRLAILKITRRERQRLRLPAAEQQAIDLGAQIKRGIRHAHHR